MIDMKKEKVIELLSGGIMIEVKIKTHNIDVKNAALKKCKQLVNSMVII